MQPDHVRVELLPHGDHSLHERCADFAAEQANAVQEGAVGQRIKRARQGSRLQCLLDQSTYQCHEGDGEARSHHELRPPEVVACPRTRKPRIQQTSHRNRGKSQRQGQPSIQPPHELEGHPSHHELRQNDPQHHRTGFERAVILNRTQIRRD